MELEINFQLMKHTLFRLQFSYLRVKLNAPLVVGMYEAVKQHNHWDVNGLTAQCE